MAKFARKYLKKNPDADERELRKTLQTRYLPDPPEGTHAQPHAYASGVGGMLGAGFGRWLKNQRHLRTCKRVNDRVENVIAQVLGDDSPTED
jgi:hypothetical protein